jgi:hypothetical protein
MDRASVRFRRTVCLGPVRLNAGLGGVGASVGARGFHMGLGPRGTYASSDVSGTGLYVMTHRRVGEEHEVMHASEISWPGALLVAAVLWVVLWVFVLKSC